MITEEVRKLAERRQDASKGIGELAKHSVTTAAQGGQLLAALRSRLQR